MVDDVQPMTLQQRIAALNAAHLGRAPSEQPPARPQPQQRPQVPTRRPDLVKQKTINIPHEQVNGSVIDARVGNLPAAPPLPTRQQPPPLPSRKSSHEDDQKGLTASAAWTGREADGDRVTATRAKSTDSLSRVKAPAWGDIELPALPTKGDGSAAARQYSSERPKYTNRAPSSTASTATLSTTPTTPDIANHARRPSLPPPLPSRKAENGNNEHVPDLGPRKVPPMPSPAALEAAKRSALSYVLNKTPSQQTTEPLSLPNTLRLPQPPPIPISSRPNLAALQATKPKPKPAITATNGTLTSHSTGCLVCRDFSGPDTHAALFSRTQVSSLQALAQQLTLPFPSLTDKARALFTWLHHNIRYDVDSFFSHNIRGSTPQSTLQSGLAVCEGYAALFSNLATHAGLESVVISGHGKGFGYHPLAPGSPLPPYSMGHAWNAVRIDHGEWKLIDACWGAGHVQGAGQPYVQHFDPSMFAMSNEEFGIKHFPGNKEHFFLPGGRRLTWEEYIRINPASWPYEGEAPTVFTNAKADYGIGEKTVMPVQRQIHVSQPGPIRFQFGLLCPHWTPAHTKKGLPPVFLVSINGVDGRNKDLVPLEHVVGSSPGGGGDVWCLDLPAKQLGTAGQTVTLFAVTTFGDRQDSRGLSVREFADGKGRVGMGFTGVAAWDLVD